MEFSGCNQILIAVMGWLCAIDLTRRFFCKYNQYYDIAEVWDPIYPDIIDLTLGEEHAVVKYLSAHNLDYYQLPRTSKIVAKTDRPSAAPHTVIPTSTSTSSTNLKSTTPLNLHNIANASQQLHEVVTSHAKSILISSTVISLIILILGIGVYHVSTRCFEKQINLPTAPEFILRPQNASTFNPIREEIMFPTKI
ncbi:hypothetical protein GE061_014764 [Apolygus lucorum]|uniref:Uncharacterized protein n=1 Tax=Apolygus lucorum TaxID=248454 RepID=A0A6A4JAP3_APOLU|nr:hypothetical protein GE061_014764 [Apolygus lucorum]